MYTYQVWINYSLYVQGDYSHCIAYMIKNRNRGYKGKVWELRQVAVPISLSDEIVSGYAPRG